MEKFRISTEILRLFYRTKLLSQVRLLQSCQFCSVSKDDGSSSSSSDSSDSSGSDSDTETKTQQPQDVSSLLGVMKVQKTEQKTDNINRQQTQGRLFKKLDKSQQPVTEQRDGMRNRRGKSKQMSLLESFQKFQPKDKNELPEIRLEPELADAVKSVAEALPGDAIKTESDLLKQLKRHDEATTAGKRGQSLDMSNMFAGLKVRKDPTQAPLQRSTQRVGSHAAGRKQQGESMNAQQDNRKETESDLLKQLKQHTETSTPEIKQQQESDLLKQLRKHAQDPSQETDKQTADFSDLISGLKITQEPKDPPHQRRGQGYGYDSRGYGDAFRMDNVREPVSLNRYDYEFEDNAERAHVRDAPYQRQRKRSLFNRRRLEIFSPETDGPTQTLDTEVALTTAELPSIWEMERQKEMEVLATPPPRHGFEEMIQLTKEGKLWIYPIDNEQGLEEERTVGFHEHVFLEHLLKGFPRKGPVRHFMELVITGLSKNAYITVQQKRDHVEWFRQYFKEKEDVLREAGALPVDNRKQIEN